jgi:uncharacterized membrane protein
MSAFRTIYRYWISILVAAVVAQIAFAGYGAFYAVEKVSDASSDEDTVEEGFGLHIGVGYLILLGVALAVILALLARPGKRTVLLTVGALVLMIVQIALAQIGEDVPAVGALHPVNAFVILGLLGSLAAQEWRMHKMGGGMGARPEPPPATPA